MKKESWKDSIKVDLTDTKEKTALRKIAKIDKKFQRLTSQNVRAHDE